MKSPENPNDAINRNRIEKYVNELTALEQNCFQTRKRNWEIQFLVRVYELCSNWRKNKVRKQRRQDLIKFIFPRKKRKDNKTVHLLIEATSKVKRRTRSRWASALLLAEKKKISVSMIERFLTNKGDGGLAARAAEYAALRKQHKKLKGRAFGKNIKSTGSKSSSTQKKTVKTRAAKSVNNDNADWD
jgi:hypothetical protein